MYILDFFYCCFGEKRRESRTLLSFNVGKIANHSKYPYKFISKYSWVIISILIRDFLIFTPAIIVADVSLTRLIRAQ